MHSWGWGVELLWGSKEKLKFESLLEALCNSKVLEPIFPYFNLVVALSSRHQNSSEIFRMPLGLEIRRGLERQTPALQKASFHVSNSLLTLELQFLLNLPVSSDSILLHMYSLHSSQFSPRLDR